MIILAISLHLQDHLCIYEEMKAADGTFASVIHSPSEVPHSKKKVNKVLQILFLPFNSVHIPQSLKMIDDKRSFFWVFFFLESAVKHLLVAGAAAENPTQ